MRNFLKNLLARFIPKPHVSPYVAHVVDELKRLPLSFMAFVSPTAVRIEAVSGPLGEEELKICAYRTSAGGTHAVLVSKTFVSDTFSKAETDALASAMIEWFNAAPGTHIRAMIDLDVELEVAPE